MLVTLADAKNHLRIRQEDDSLDATLTRSIEQASSIVLDYVKLDAAPDPVPDFVQAATLYATEAMLDGGDPLSEIVLRLLHRFRDPAMS